MYSVTYHNDQVCARNPISVLLVQHAKKNIHHAVPKKASSQMNDAHIYAVNPSSPIDQTLSIIATAIDR
jgi:hypothetical protein